MEKNYFLMKFGRKEHLEELKSGHVYFNSIENYRHDGTLFRGDSLEGKIPIDPRTVTIWDSDGNNISDILPTPDLIAESFAGDEELLMFCCSAITEKILVKNNDVYVFGENYKQEMRKFGEYAIAFWESDLLNKLQSTYERNSFFAYDCRLITYYDKFDFSPTEVYGKGKDRMRRYFEKDISYQLQNEWRIIMDGVGAPLPLNEQGGYMLQIPPLDNALILPTEDMLNGFELEHE